MVVGGHALKCYDCNSKNPAQKACFDEHLNLTSMPTCDDAKQYCYKFCCQCPVTKSAC